MKALSSRRSRTFLALGVGAALSVLGSAEAPEQEKCKMSWEVPAANATYTGQHASDGSAQPVHGAKRSEIDNLLEGIRATSSASPRTRTCRPGARS